jgi:uncharacterized protein (DUF1778 family)
MNMTKGYEQRKEANARYLAKFESILIRVTPEEKEFYQKAAEASGMSLTAFMRAAAQDYIDKKRP